MDFSEIIVQTVVSYPFEENTYLIHLKEKKDCIVVDPGMEPDKILEFAKKENLNFSAILITHGHGDHIAGVGAIKRECSDCVIYVGEEEKEKLSDPGKNLSRNFGFDLAVPEADILVRDGEKLDIAEIPIEVRHTPGHSKGHVVYLVRCEPTSLLFVGDVIFRQGIGRYDFPDGNRKELFESIQTKILTLPDDTIIFPGHGPSTTVGAERRDNPYLQ